MSDLSLFGDQLTRLMRESGISQAEFARRVGKSSGVVQFIRVGKRTPPIDHLDRWANALGVRGDAREEFILAGWLEHAPRELRDYVARLRRRSGEGGGARRAAEGRSSYKAGKKR